MTPTDPVDANTINFPLQLVLTLGGLVIALMVGYFTGQSQWKSEMAGLRSDVRDGFTMISGEQKANTIVVDIIRRDLDAQMKAVELLKLQRQEDHDAIILLKRGTK